MKKAVRIILHQVLSLTIFGVIFTVSIFLVNGYRYSFTDRQIVQTGIIDVCIKTPGAVLKLDGQLVSQTPCEQLHGVTLGNHELTAEKPGYMTWKKRFYTNARTAAIFPEMILIPEKALWTSRELEGLEEVGVKWEPVKEWVSGVPKPPLLSVNGLEVWREEGSRRTLVTRYSEPVETALHFREEGNIIIAGQNLVRLCDANGENCLTVSEKDPETPVLQPAGTSAIILVKDGKVIEITLNEPQEE